MICSSCKEARAFFAALRARCEWDALIYLRLHGAPRVYYSEYRADQIERFAQKLAGAPSDCPAWCIFDNTAAGAALVNALALQERLQELIAPRDGANRSRAGLRAAFRLREKGDCFT